jgi:glycopeptide antibiotics resistance protein
MDRMNRTTITLAGWTGLIVMAGTLPLHNFVGHPHWGLIEWTVTPRHWRSPKFYFDVVANVGLFYPFGLLLARQFPFTRIAQALALVGAGLILSLAIELFQVYCHNRHPSLIDVVSNTIGTAVGAASARTLFLHRRIDAWLPPAHSHPTGS